MELDLSFIHLKKLVIFKIAFLEWQNIEIIFLQMKALHIFATKLGKLHILYALWFNLLEKKGNPTSLESFCDFLGQSIEFNLVTQN